MYAVKVIVIGLVLQKQKYMLDKHTTYNLLSKNNKQLLQIS